jgi:hypothetical protein
MNRKHTMNRKYVVKYLLVIKSHFLNKLLNKNICTHENKFVSNHIHGCKFYFIQCKKLDIDTKCLLQLCANTEEFVVNSFFDEAMVLTQNKTIKYERRS